MKNPDITNLEEIRYYLDIGYLKYVISNVDPVNPRLYSLDDLLYKDYVKEEWEKFPHCFVAKKYHLKPNISKGSIFRTYSGDFYVRYNNERISDIDFNFGKRYDVENLIWRKASYLGTDCRNIHHQNLWNKEWEEYVHCLDDNDSEEDIPQMILQSINDEKLDDIMKINLFGKSEQEIIKTIKVLCH